VWPSNPAGHDWASPARGIDQREDRLAFGPTLERYVFEFAAAEAAQARQPRTYPQPAIPVLCDRPYSRLKLLARIAEFRQTGIIEALESSLGADPYGAGLQTMVLYFSTRVWLGNCCNRSIWRVEWLKALSTLLWNAARGVASVLSFAPLEFLRSHPHSTLRVITRLM
jgi:hypothetical protein